MSSIFPALDAGIPQQLLCADTVWKLLQNVIESVCLFAFASLWGSVVREFSFSAFLHGPGRAEFWVPV